MSKPIYIQGKDGKFAGSIGVGASATPTRVPSRVEPVAATPASAGPTLADYVARFSNLSRIRPELLRPTDLMALAAAKAPAPEGYRNLRDSLIRINTHRELYVRLAAARVAAARAAQA